MSPDQYRAQAQSLAGSGDLTGARRVLEQACSEHRNNASLANSAGNMAMKAGESDVAVAAFGKAAALDPTSIEFATNHAIALSALGRHREALAALVPHENAGERDARFCSVRASAARGAGSLDDAAEWYDRSLAAAPGGAKATHGRARVALERGEADAARRFERAVTLNQTDPEAWLGLAEALDLAGESGRARDLAQQLVGQAPHWVAALRLLAQIRLAAGKPDFASHFAEAERKLPQDAAIARAHVEVLDSHDLFDQALEVAAAARVRFADDPAMALLEAAQAGVAGEDERAEAIFSELEYDAPARWLQEARHCIRTDQYGRAERLLDRLLSQQHDHISAWAMRDLLWRASGDERSDWLHGQEGLVQMVELPEAEAVLRDAVPLLHGLHDRAAFPLGQSLRGGTQTRGNLFQRTEPALTRLHRSLMQALEIYRSGLPGADGDHPLLKHRDEPWAITGSWSVRLSGGGDHHAAHLHPQGVISSAFYCELPDDLGEQDDRAGWIELGRPPPEMRMALEPLHSLRPRRGHLALFPSTLYHGTRPFTEGRRMTVAFDVIMDDR